MPKIQTSEEARALIARRWEKPRPAPRDNRVRTLPVDSELEAHYMTLARTLGLVPEPTTRNAHRRIAKRLADSEVALKIKRVHLTEPVSISDDDDLLITHLQREAESCRARARRDRQIALAHELRADQAEAALAALLLRLGLATSEAGSIEDDFA